MPLTKFGLPKRYDFQSIEKKWIKKWKQLGVYKFSINEPGSIYSIDTPPPFTSGTLHMGHILNHTWIDIAARFHRMIGDNVYFPQGFDCHGLPTELKVEKEFGVSKDNQKLFLEKCWEWTRYAIKKMKKQFDQIGYSTDWNYTYRTMDKEYKRIVQKSLLYFYERKWLYRKKHPVHWCTNCQTALAKQEVGYIDKTGKLWYIKLPLADDTEKTYTIATTRPEMLPACVAVLYNPDDSKYTGLNEKKIKLPLFDREIPIISDRRVDMEFGTGLVYLCTYGDEQDIEWQEEYDLPVITIISKDGKMTDEAGKYKDKSIEEARKEIVKDLDEQGFLEKVEEMEHRVIAHTERSACKMPIEYLPIKQWFISVRPFKKEIIDAAKKMNWYPEKMIIRLLDWTNSLDWDWVISRQRVFGTPIPFWICKDCDQEIPAKEEDLPINPILEDPPFIECPNCKGKNLEPVVDVCDCWVDSSVTPLIITKWMSDEDFFKKSYPTTMRPQGYEIIRTWAFYTIFRCLKLTNEKPFKDIMLNGMVGGPDGRKMSKSYGNVVQPEDALDPYGADAVRQWASMGTLGDDYPYTDKEMQYSSRFLNKLWNACRFANMHLKKVNIEKIDEDTLDFNYIDKWILSELNKLIVEIRNNFEQYNFHAGLSMFRKFFWHKFCDNYLESVKHRIYIEEKNKDKITAIYVLFNIVLNSLKLFAPIAPFITDEIHEYLFKEYTKKDSIHECQWPQIKWKIKDNEKEKGEIIIDVISEIRSDKSAHSIPLNKEIPLAYIETGNSYIPIFQKSKDDIIGTLKIVDLDIDTKPPEKDFQYTTELDEHKIYWDI
ncbi:MAG: valine--tRNA ligase [Candidatus Lokiarchaeota archaeon]|nr:valine--tRNA ligase [Candidatus Lokiarchaeota archaeon]